eukprot:Em0011g274a
MMCEMKVMAVGERSMETVGIKWTGPEAVIVNSAAVIAAVNGAAVSVAAGSVVADQQTSSTPTLAQEEYSDLGVHCASLLQLCEQLGGHCTFLGHKLGAEYSITKSSKNFKMGSLNFFIIDGNMQRFTQAEQKRPNAGPCSWIMASALETASLGPVITPSSRYHMETASLGPVITPSSWYHMETASLGTSNNTIILVPHGDSQPWNQ